MKLKEYLKYLNDIVKKYPNLDVIYSSDDEGNSFSKVYYIPAVGYYDKHGEFHVDSEKNNAVCLN